MLAPPVLPADADSLLEPAVQSMIATLAKSAKGMLVVDRGPRAVWISEGYKSLLPALGFAAQSDFIGKRAAAARSSAAGCPKRARE